MHRDCPALQQMVTTLLPVIARASLQTVCAIVPLLLFDNEAPAFAAQENLNMNRLNQAVEANFGRSRNLHESTSDLKALTFCLAI